MKIKVLYVAEVETEIEVNDDLTREELELVALVEDIPIKKMEEAEWKIRKIRKVKTQK